MNGTLPVSEADIVRACGEIELPEVGLIEQQWDVDPIPVDSVADTGATAVASLDFSQVPSGGEIAIGAGSRGIANLGPIVSGVVAGVRDAGYEPFVFPAMGSHGGATAEGQREKLATLGVTEERLGCEIRSSMEVIEIGRTPERDVPVYVDADAAQADGILPVNRIKPHTDFSGDVESGLSKMLVIGMGKQRGAKMAHDWAVDWSLRNMLPEITDRLLASLPVVGGVAIVEDQHDDTSIIEGVPPSGFLTREAELLDIARERMPRLPFEDIDVLIVDRLGKDVSGQGMDTNVTGRRHFTINEPEPETPTIKRIYARGLTEKTSGNAMGMGAADIVHKDLLSGLDMPKSLINAITASTVRGVRLPPVVETDRAGVIATLGTCGPLEPSRARLLRISDTMHLAQCEASSALLEAARDRDDLRVLADAEPIRFDDDGAFERPTPGRDPMETPQ